MRSRTIMRRGVAWLAVGCLASSMTPPAATAQEVVQQLPNPATEQLRDAMQRLSRNPESLPALIAAGRASLALDDVDAADGFFQRGQAIEPNNGALLAGLAVVSLRRESPGEALDLFDRAQSAGEDLSPYAADQGLAYDLVGENVRAQERYDVALSHGENAETVRRLALSYAIAGDQYASESVLLPLLQRRDLAAYRTRAFALAILGREDEAISIAETMLPARLSRRLTPYLRYMPQLTRAQQAAAANLGRFPSVANIGRDEPRLARRSELPAANRPQPSVDVGSRLVPEGEPLGPVAEELPAIAANTQNNAAATALERAQNAQERRPDAAITLLLPKSDNAPQPTFSLSQSEREVAEQLPSLQEAFSDFSLTGGVQDVAPAPGAVDLTTFEPAREQREPEPPPPPAHPSRHWVQVATGQDLSAFRFDWRRLVRNSDGLLEGRDAFHAPWNRTNRLLTGPFDSTRDAQQFVTALAEAGISAFRFTSAEGEEISPLN